MANFSFSMFPNENFLDLRLYQYGWEACAPLHSFGPSVRNHYLFHYIISGRGWLDSTNRDGKTHKHHLSQDQGFLICPQQVTTYCADKSDPWKYVWLEFDGLRVEEDGSVWADYAVTGNFANIAYKEAKKYGEISLAASSEDKNHTYIPRQDQLKLDPQASYFYYCANNTIYGTEWQYVPDTGDVPIVCDMSSDFLSRPVDVSKYGIIFGGAQKNLAPAGLTIAVVREDLAGHELPFTPLMMNYKTMIDKDSMYNTPPCWCIYMLGLVLEWLDSKGGVEGMEKIKHSKAALLYDVLDNSRLFTCPAQPGSRSDMNVTFRSASGELDAKFVQEAVAAGFTNLKGHRNVGGMRASIYNAMPVEGVEKLADFIREFDKNT